MEEIDEAELLEGYKNWKFWRKVRIAQDDDDAVTVEDYVNIKRKLQSAIKLLAKADQPIQDSVWFQHLCKVLEE